MLTDRCCALLREPLPGRLVGEADCLRCSTWCGERLDLVSDSLVFVAPGGSRGLDTDSSALCVGADSVTFSGLADSWWLGA
jgi:hypothetical protein